MVLPFLTIYDPLSSSSGSIDPLGALRSYGALADLLVPGVTTITTRSRYLSMLCWALANAETHAQFPPGSAGLVARRKSVEPFERLWGLACVAASDEGVKAASDGLRGITYAEDAFEQFKKGPGRVTPDFRMLKYQGRTGAVGTYWTAMVGGQLVDQDSGALMPEGCDLAKEFPSPQLGDSDLQKLADPQRAYRVAMPMEDLVEWARKCHLVAATRSEKRLLREALTADDRRECLSQALIALNSTQQLPDTWDISWMKRLRETFSRNARATEQGLPTVVDAVIRIEQFHEAMLSVFELLLWWGTQNSSNPLDELFLDIAIDKFLHQAQATARSLLDFRATCALPDVRKGTDSLASFASSIDRCRSPDELVTNTLLRHHRVQSGKLDGGAPKRDWIEHDHGNGRLLRPSPAFQRLERPAVPRGQRLTHPYRLEQFAYMLRENGALPRTRSQ